MLVPLALVVVGIFAAVLGPAIASSAHAEEQVEPEPTTTTLELTSTPAGATVKVDGETRGQTPLELEVAADETLAVEVSHPGYESLSRELDAESGELAFELTSLPFRLVVEGLPEGAELTIAGEARTEPTLDFETAPEGPVSVQVAQRGYAPFAREVALDAFEATDTHRVATVEVSLERIVRARPARRAAPAAAEPAPAEEPAAPAAPAPVPDNPF